MPLYVPVLAYTQHVPVCPKRRPSHLLRMCISVVFTSLQTSYLLLFTVAFNCNSKALGYTNYYFPDRCELAGLAAWAARRACRLPHHARRDSLHGGRVPPLLCQPWPASPPPLCASQHASACPKPRCSVCLCSWRFCLSSSAPCLRSSRRAPPSRSPQTSSPCLVSRRRKERGQQPCPGRPFRGLCCNLQESTPWLACSRVCWPPHPCLQLATTLSPAASSSSPYLWCQWR